MRLEIDLDYLTEEEIAFYAECSEMEGVSLEEWIEGLGGL